MRRKVDIGRETLIEKLHKFSAEMLKKIELGPRKFSISVKP